MQKRRGVDGFNLAFLDVMACGLGAVILIFMLVKFHAETPIPSEEVERLRAELEALQSAQDEKRADLQQTEQQNRDQRQAIADAKAAIDQLKRQSAEAKNTLADKEAVLAELEDAIAAAAPEQAADPIELQGKGEERYLLGLKVEGRHIGILLDHSASMTDEKLMDIIRRKVGNDAERQAAPKWQRTKRVARWLLARLPENAKVSLIGFNDKAELLGPQNLVSASNSQGLQRLAEAIDDLVPAEGTNLQAALDKVAEVNPQMSHLYIVTDGLPTLGASSSGLSGFRKCGSFFGRASTISGECREHLFYNTVREAKLARVQVNVILLPLEGDPNASQAFWNWTSNTGGLTISPADSWP